MLIRLTIENWMSFRDPTTFTMIPSNEGQHSDRLSKIDSYDLNLLPTAAIFGGNASGKSNFVSALKFARDFVVHGINEGDLIPIEPFLLEEKFEEGPTNFRVELLIEDTVFVYEFSTTREIVVSESLIKIENNKKNIIYEINRDNIKLKENSEHREIFDILFKNKKKNRLFMTTISIASDIELSVHKWFKDNLVVIGPKDRIRSAGFYTNRGLLARVNDILKTLDCGVSKLDFENYPVPDEFKKLHNAQLAKVHYMENPKNRMIAFKDGDDVIAKKLVTYHEDNKAKPVMFEIEKESDGTIRLFDLLPAFIGLSQPNSKEVFVIDEIDQSLHTKMLSSLIEAFLDNCSSDSRSQLIFTTHNTLLMNSDYLRNDEIWLADRDRSGNSKLYSIGEYEGIDPGMDIRESYMIGRFGGTPDMLLIGSQLSHPLIEKAEEK